MAEQLRITYSPPGEEVQTVYIPRESSRATATKDDAKNIAKTMLERIPGTTYRDHWVHVERVDVFEDNDTQKVRRKGSLLSWESKTKRQFERSIKPLQKELASTRKNARKSGIASAEGDRKENGVDKGFTWGRWRARFRAWSPLLSENYGLAAIATGIGIADRHPYLVAGLGKDVHDLTHEIRPGKTVEELQESIEGILRRLQDSVLDPADIVHGIGKGLVNIIEEHQRGVGGVLLALGQAEYPKLGDIIEGIMNAESLTSPDRKRSKISLASYDIAQTHALKSRIEKHAKKKIRLFGKRRDAIMHRLIWAPTSVVATELDRRSERQDRIDMEYIRMIISDTSTQSPGFQRFRQDLALALNHALIKPRTQEETFARKLSGESSEIEAKAVAKLKEVLPPYWWNVVEKGLSVINGKREQRPQDYKDALQKLKQSETEQSYYQYIQTLKPIAEHYSQDERPYLGKDRVLWKQASAYADYMLNLADLAQKATPRTRRNA